MPFALQADLLSMSYRAHLMSEYGLFGLQTNQLIAHYIYALNLTLLKPFFSDITQFFSYSHGMSIASTTSSTGDWLNFVVHPQVNAFIFALKIPHLLADIAVFFLLSKFLVKIKNRSLILALWWFNPVNLYAFYVFSRHDSLTLLAVLLAIIFLAKAKIFSSLIALFVAVQVRFQPLLYLPIFLIHLWRNFSVKKIFVSVLFTTLAISAVLLVERNLPFNQEILDQVRGVKQENLIASSSEASSVKESLLKSIAKPFSLATSVGGSSTMNKLLIFSFAYLLLNFFYFTLRKTADTKESFLQINLILYIALALYFLINDFSPHYFVWISLFATAGSMIGKKFLYSYLLSILGWALMGLFSYGNFAINQNLFLPISRVIFGTPQLAYILPFAESIFKFGHLLLILGLLASSLFAFRYLAKRAEKPKNWLSLLKISSFALFLFLSVSPSQVQAAKVPVLEMETQNRFLLEPRAVYRGNFISPVESFGALDLKFDTSRSKEKHFLIFRIKKAEAEKWHYENTYDTSDFYNNAFYPFGFPPITQALGQNFIYEVQLKGQSDSSLYIYQDSYVVSKDGNMGEILEIVKTDLQAKWQTQKSFFIFWLFLLGANLFAIVLVLFVYRNNKKATF